jgi:hypothetical protein
VSPEGATVALAITGEPPNWDVTPSVTFDVTLEIASFKRPSVPDVAEAAEE